MLSVLTVSGLKHLICMMFPGAVLYALSVSVANFRNPSNFKEPYCRNLSLIQSEVKEFFSIIVFLYLAFFFSG